MTTPCPILIESALASRELTDDEHAAMHDSERPGIWRASHEHGWVNGALLELALTQHETDYLICAELWRKLVGDELLREVYACVRELEGIIGTHLTRGPVTQGGRILIAQIGSESPIPITDQRGGIHSDPLVRLIAFRVWGQRDRVWPFVRAVCTSLPLRTEAGERRTWFDGPFAVRLLHIVDRGSAFSQ